MSTPEHSADDLGLEGFAAPTEDQGLSLDELSEAYAELVNQGDDPYRRQKPPQAPHQVVLEVEQEQETEEPDESESRSCEVSPRSILEAILFVGDPENQPLSSQVIASLMRGVRPAEIDDLVCELNEEYAQQDAPYTITTEGGGYRLVLREEFFRLRDRFYGRVKEAKLSQSAVDVLAVVAYKQPVTREEVDQMRGRSSGALLNQLVRRQLLAVQRNDAQPRKKQYRTTQRFLKIFGLEQLEDLPQG